MASHVSQCMAGTMHVGHMACHVSTCMALLKAINMGVSIQFVGSIKKKEEEGKRKGKKKREEKKKEEERKKKEEKEGVLAQ